MKKMVVISEELEFAALFGFLVVVIHRYHDVNVAVRERAGEVSHPL